MNVEQIARVAHEANGSYCASLGDLSQPSWDEAPTWQRDSAIAGVNAMLDGSAKTSEEQHELWSQHKLADGWVYGPEKNAETKTHPCLVPYSELPREQQKKDALFRAVVFVLGAPDGSVSVYDRATTVGA